MVGWKRPKPKRRFLWFANLTKRGKSHPKLPSSTHLQPYYFLHTVKAKQRQWFFSQNKDEMRQETSGKQVSKGTKLSSIHLPVPNTRAHAHTNIIQRQLCFVNQGTTSHMCCRCDRSNKFLRCYPATANKKEIRALWQSTYEAVKTTSSMSSLFLSI